VEICKEYVQPNKNDVVTFSSCLHNLGKEKRRDLFDRETPKVLTGSFEVEQRSESTLEKFDNPKKRDSLSPYRMCRFPDSGDHAFLRPSRFPVEVYEPDFCFRMRHHLSMFKYG